MIFQLYQLKTKGIDLFSYFYKICQENIVISSKSILLPALILSECELKQLKDESVMKDKRIAQ